MYTSCIPLPMNKALPPNICLKDPLPPLPMKNRIETCFLILIANSSRKYLANLIQLANRPLLKTRKVNRDRGGSY